jgi:hypothetical protein
MANQIDTDAKIIGENDSGFGQNHVVTASDGRIYAGHVNDSNYLEIHYSDDGGSNWTLDNTTSEEVGDGFFSMCLSENDDLFVCFVTGSGTSYTVRIKFRDESDGTWSEVYSSARTVENSGEQPYALITYNRYINRLHVFWTEHPSGTALNIYSDYSDNYGSTWNGITTSWTTGSYSTGNYIFRAFGLDTNPSNGNVHLLYTFEYFTDKANRMKFDSSGSELDDIDLTTTIVIGGGLAIDSSGNKYDLVYASDYDLHLYKNGVSNTVYSTGSDDLKRGMFDIGIDGQDNVYCFYVKESDGKTYYKKYDGSSFGSETEVATGARIGCEQHALGSSVILNTVYFNT